LRSRQIAPVALVLGLTVAGFVIARVLAEHGARRDSEHRAEVAAAQIRGRVAEAVSLTESLRLFMVNAGGTGVTSAQFKRNAFWWLSPADLPAAAWVEQVPAARRAAYEQRVGQPIVSPDAQSSGLPTGSRSSYLPATLVSGFPPLSVAGIDLSGEPGMAEALERATRHGGVAATALRGAVAGTRGLFLVAPAPNLIDEVLHPGYVVLFVPHGESSRRKNGQQYVPASRAAIRCRRTAAIGPGNRGSPALDHPRRRARPRRPRGSARTQRRAASPSAGRAGPHLQPFLRPDRGR
jgi:hypothetical protein